MIKYNTKEWFSLIFKFHKSDTFRRLLPAILLVAVYAAVIAYIEIEIWELKYKPTVALHSLLGLVISLLLVFRTNTAYDRWWEGRKLWGTLVNNSRNLSIKMSVIVSDDNERKHIQKWIKLFPFVLKKHLRDQKHVDVAIGIHQPNFVIKQMMVFVQGLYETGKITGEQLITLNAEITTYTDICGGCERIRKTPIPYSYSLFLKKFIFIYVMTIPFAFIKEFSVLIVPATALVFYVLVSMEVIAEEIEDPFGEDSNDLPTDELADTISKNVTEIFAF